MTRNSKGDEWIPESGKEYNDRISKEAKARQPKTSEPVGKVEPAQPDCRTCANFKKCGYGVLTHYGTGCTNGDKYEAAPKVVLWRTEA